MSLVLDTKLLDRMRKICLEQKDKIKFSILVGAIEQELNEITMFTAVHFPIECKTQKQNVTITFDEVNQLLALQFMLPYNMEIIGISFYTEEDISAFTLKILATSVSKIPTLKFLVNVQQVEIKYYQLAEDKPTKINAKVNDVATNNLLNFIHTIEFETSEEILNDINELKKSIFSGIDLYWDRSVFSKNDSMKLSEIQSTKSPLDRIVEITIPSEDKKLPSKTENGKVFLAFDLHMNLFVPKSLRNKQIKEIKQILKQALKRDLLVKLQRATYDKEINRLIAPNKIPMKFFGLELNAYLSKDNPSKFELDLCNNLIFHTTIMASIGKDLQARIFLRDLATYYHTLKDEEKQLELGKLVVKFSN